MANPLLPHLVFGTVLYSSGAVVSKARLSVVTSESTKIYTANSDGVFLFDISNQGYVDGETVSIDVTESFNNELITHKFVVSGFTTEGNIILELRTVTPGVTGYPIKSVLHGV